MSPDQTTMLLLFGALVCAPVALNYAASRIDYSRYVDAFFAAVMLCTIWATTNIIGAVFPFPDSKKFHSLIDLIGLSGAVAAYMTQRQRWKLILAFLFLAQLATHAGFWWLWNTDRAAITPLGSISYSYALVLNVLWLAQVVCVSTPGGACVGTVLARRLLRPHRRVPDLARP